MSYIGVILVLGGVLSIGVEIVELHRSWDKDISHVDNLSRFTSERPHTLLLFGFFSVAFGLLLFFGVLDFTLIARRF